MIGRPRGLDGLVRQLCDGHFHLAEAPQDDVDQRPFLARGLASEGRLDLDLRSDSCKKDGPPDVAAHGLPVMFNRGPGESFACVS